MRPIEKDEIYQNLTSFLKSRGIELKEGNYAKGIQQSCEFLTDSINLSQEGIERAKAEFDRNLDHLRQLIHEHTAPRPKPEPKSNVTVEAEPPKSASASSAPKSKPHNPKASKSPKSKARKSKH